MPYKCKEKQKEAQRQHYLNNKATYVSSLNERRQRNQDFAHSLKDQCSICGMSETVCLDFHHRDSNEKLDTVAQMIHNGTTLQIIREEILKCDVLCANCHHKEHMPLEITDGSTWKNFSPGRIAKRRWFIGYIKTQKCLDCGENDSRCLEFHHVGEKRFKIAYLLTSGHSLEFLQEEITRCVPLCSNCHRKKHPKI